MKITAKELEVILSLIGLEKCDSNILAKLKSFYLFYHHKEPRKKNVIFLTSEDKAYVWGSNRDGILGTGDEKPIEKEPALNEDLSELKITQFVAGGAHLLALTEQGHVYSWGFNRFGQLGRYPRDPVLATPDKIWFEEDDGEIRMIAAGKTTSAAITRQSFVYVWGSNISGGIGNVCPTRVNFIVHPKKLLIKPSRDPFIDIVASASTFFIRTAEGRLLTWGDNRRGEAGVGKKPEIKDPTIVNLKQGPLIVKKIACSGRRSLLALDHKGGIWTWGPGPKEFKYPQNVALPSGLSPITDLVPHDDGVALLMKDEILLSFRILVRKHNHLELTLNDLRGSNVIGALIKETCVKIGVEVEHHDSGFLSTPSPRSSSIPIHRPPAASFSPKASPSTPLSPFPHISSSPSPRLSSIPKHRSNTTSISPPKPSPAAPSTSFPQISSSRCESSRSHTCHFGWVDLSKLLDVCQRADIEIQFSLENNSGHRVTRKLLAHKWLLERRAPHFLKWIEKISSNSDPLPLGEYSYENCKSLLFYIYSGNIPPMSLLMLSCLHKVGKRLLIPYLSSNCLDELKIQAANHPVQQLISCYEDAEADEEFQIAIIQCLTSRFNLDTFLALAKFALKHHIDPLLDAATRFLRDNKILRAQIMNEPDVRLKAALLDKFLTLDAEK